MKDLTIKTSHKDLVSKNISAQELTREILKRIKEMEPKINGFIRITEDLAINQAKKVDDLLANGQSISMISGVPASLKDVLVTKDVVTTAGSKILENFNPPYSATAAEKLLDNGLVLVGKTNMDEFAMGASTENSAYKITKNPWDVSRVPGGSSGGSAASVAAGMCIYSLGSDTGGSVRQPASFCGVVGLKPTYGRVSRYGLIAMASSLDQIGPITKTVEDSAILLNIISGFDSKDATSAVNKVPDYTKVLGKSVKGLKIGLPKEFFGEGISKDVKETILIAVKVLENLGAKIVDISLPRSKEAISVYYLIMPSEVSANLARYDGIRYGKTRDKFGAEVKRRLMLGTYALSSGYYDAYYLKAAKVRTLIREEFSNAFKKIDCIVGPTAPTTAFKIGEKIDNPLAMYLADILTVSANLAGIPAISLPCGFIKGVPVGLQIMANYWQEETIFQVAYAYEQSQEWYARKPNL
ncbi:MAG: aspartyl/glutamyl-tRNA amidotransferase subunit A [Candidatus Woykebacteria bacterium RIFCSPHIGHO2_01_FULL_39_12]|uniref:Glutamyl-tRNA(Gln) amidotransferase subunit A n=1 Tax=Candidatus Woykebacteria bacterium RIFCSPHIGHO2_01_FULL_39_12 TaxID=1802599 RepID=A0A1G1WJK2_9BACT|nr:MAG: aspartyl/glutamyl-tRNA amidotransferase subunit A [Candidatus Woykebacteria bacterium RIFCSPHIGHO2_01_FULL_39_12]